MGFDPVPPATEACANCGTAIAGEYCPACGQRRFRPADRRMGHLLAQFVEALSDLDSRFWRSLRALLFQPGRLSQDWFRGRRAYWMSPISIFLLANLLYFFAPGLTDFDLGFREHVNGAFRADFDPRLRDADPTLRERVARSSGQLHSPFTDALTRRKLDAVETELRGNPATAALDPFDVLTQRYALASANVSKLLIVLHVPFLAAALMLLMLGTRRYFAEHFVFALHYFAFLLFFIELAVLPGAWIARGLGVSAIPDWVRWLSAAIWLAYAVFSTRRAYACGWPRAVSVGLLLPVLLLAVHIGIYRGIQFLVVLGLA